MELIRIQNKLVFLVEVDCPNFILNKISISVRIIMFYIGMTDNFITINLNSWMPSYPKFVLVCKQEQIFLLLILWIKFEKLFLTNAENTFYNKSIKTGWKRPSKKNQRNHWSFSWGKGMVNSNDILRYLRFLKTFYDFWYDLFWRLIARD